MNYGWVLMIMQDEFPSSPVVIEYTPEFKRNLPSLAKKYRNIRSDVQPVIQQLQEKDYIGVQIPKTGGYTIFKVRVKNSDIRKEKSAGYRLIFFLKNEDSVILITIYSKTEQSDISPDEIRQIIEMYDDI